MEEIKSCSDLIKLTGLTGSSVWVDPEIIVALEELDEVKDGKVVKYFKRTRIDIREGDKTIPGAYIVKQTATYINTQMENVIARNQMKERKEIASEVREAVVSDIIKKGRIFKAIKEIIINK